jgi:protein TonB
MNTNNNYQWNRLFFLVIVPIVCLNLIFTPYLFAQEFAKETSSNKSFKLDLVREAPIYKGCDNLNSEFEIRKCLSEKITNHFNEHFNFDVLKNLDYETESKRIYIQFVINENGEIESPLAASPATEEINKEAIRVINKIPKMTPGKRKGKPVGVKYRVVIDSSLEEKIEINSGSPVY